MLLQPVIDRIAAETMALGQRVGGAAEYSAMLQSSGARAATAGAYVMPAGLRGGSVRAAAGAFVQDYDEVIAVVVIVPDASASMRGLGSIDSQIRGVIDALAGWEPEGAMGPFSLLRGAMINLGAGLLAYQLEFSISDQVRKAT